MRSGWLVLIFLGLLLQPAAATPDTQDAELQQIRVPKARSAHDVSYNYYFGLLKRVLELGAHGRPIPKIMPTLEMEQGRAVRELAVHRSIDLMWMGTDADKERQLRAVRIPLERGLMGYRKFTIHRDLAPTLDKVQLLKPLQKLVSCQGLDWPDNRVLKHAGFTLMTSPVYENLFKQTNAKRCDLFPRGLHEGEAELKERQQLYPALLRYQDIMLRYPFGIYFFTNQDNETLALWLQDGLEQMTKSGELLRYMQQHPLTAHVFPLSKHRSSRWFELTNPDLPASQVTDRRYWFTAEDFQ